MYLLLVITALLRFAVATSEHTDTPCSDGLNEQDAALQRGSPTGAVSMIEKKALRPGFVSVYASSVDELSPRTILSAEDKAERLKRIEAAANKAEQEHAKRMKHLTASGHGHVAHDGHHSHAHHSPSSSTAPASHSDGCSFPSSPASPLSHSSEPADWSAALAECETEVAALRAQLQLMQKYVYEVPAVPAEHSPLRLRASASSSFLTVVGSDGTVDQSEGTSSGPQQEDGSSYTSSSFLPVVGSDGTVGQSESTTSGPQQEDGY
ncbi:unnamed protein product [Amoebophrya sp. A120]|nr:unnamed protein product [Amoebophrya sp. A120]|eukprot:GSA120T00008897001.1